MSADDPSGAPSVTTMIFRESSPEVASVPGLVVDPGDHARITAAVRGFGLSDPIQAWPLMNRNWRVRTREGEWAVKQIRDIDAEAARRQHRVTRVLAELGLPVPPPHRSPEEDSVVKLAGRGVFAVLPWVQGVHRDGRDLDPRQCRHLGGLLARIHQGLGSEALAGVLAPPPGSQVIGVSETAKAKGPPGSKRRIFNGHRRLRKSQDLKTIFACRPVMIPIEASDQRKQPGSMVFR